MNIFSATRSCRPTVVLRSLATGARQGSSIQNVRMVKYGKYEIPARLLARWLKKQEKLSSVNAVGSSSTSGVAAHAAALERRFSAPFHELNQQSTAEIADAMRQQWLAYKTMRVSWIALLCRSVRTADDFALCVEAWLVFQSRVEFAANPLYTGELLRAAQRSNQLTAFAELMQQDVATLALTPKLMARLLALCDSTTFVPTWTAVLNYCAAQPIPEQVVVAALRHCVTPTLLPHGIELVKYYQENEYPLKRFAVAAMMKVLIANGNVDEALALDKRAMGEESITNKYMQVFAKLKSGLVDDALKQWQQIENRNPNAFAIHLCLAGPSELHQLIAVADDLNETHVSHALERQTTSSAAAEQSSAEQSSAESTDPEESPETADESK